MFNPYWPFKRKFTLGHFTIIVNLKDDGLFSERYDITAPDRYSAMIIAYIMARGISKNIDWEYILKDAERNCRIEEYYYVIN